MASIEVAARVRESLSRWAQPLGGTEADYDDLVGLIGDARVVMLGEASHGTHEFYAVRAEITKRLIARHNFTFVAIEGDWPDTYRVDRWVKGGDGTVRQALEGFKRFPTWMWRNVPVEAFLTWLREFNDAREAEAQRVGFYGLDVYSLHTSMGEVIKFLRKVDPEAADRAARHYACLDPFVEDTSAYAWQVHFTDQSCEDEVVRTMLDLRTSRETHAERGGAEAAFDAELNALAATNAERYYRLMVRGGATTWNLRDRHMMAVLERLLDKHGPRSKAIVWEHNSHIGDFRATHEGQGGYLNVGQLVREKFGPSAIAVGFGSHRGTVTAAHAWDGEPKFMRVPPAREGSYEHAFVRIGPPNFYLPLARIGANDAAGGWLRETRGERAIGVVYDPAREHFGNYVPTRLADRYDAYLFFDSTFAVEPLDPGMHGPGIEGYPTGL